MARKTTFHIKFLKCYSKPTRPVEVKTHHIVFGAADSTISSPQTALLSVLSAGLTHGSKSLKVEIVVRGP